MTILLATVKGGRWTFLVCHDSFSNIFYYKRRKTKKAQFFSCQDHAFFHFLSTLCNARRFCKNEIKDLVTKATFPPWVVPTGPWGHERCLPGLIYLDFLLWHSCLDRTILFASWESAANKTRSHISLVGTGPLKNRPSIQTKAKAKRVDLCGLIFPCV